jgi:hypothetical protein
LGVVHSCSHDAGLLALCIYSASLHSWSVLGCGLGVTAAAIMAGGLLGFLFGIPRTIVNATTSGQGGGYEGITNLEQISDWLTKILVGVGLVQIARAPTALAHLADAMAPGFGGVSSSGGFGLALAIFFSATGFLYLYLWSRIDFLLELRSLNAIRATVRAAAKAIVSATETEKQAILSKIDRALNPQAGVATPNSEELTAAISGATPYLRQQTFQRAEEQRRQNWRSNPDRMTRTIPVFEALIATDKDNRYHRNHGELGFALKDLHPPQLQRSFEELSTAITMRGSPPSEKGWAAYELNRAVCRILLDSALDANSPSTVDVAAAIVADLQAADTDSYNHSLIGKVEIQGWLTRNPDALDVAQP